MDTTTKKSSFYPWHKCFYKIFKELDSMVLRVQNNLNGFYLVSLVSLIYADCSLLITYHLLQSLIDNTRAWGLKTNNISIGLKLISTCLTNIRPSVVRWSCFHQLWSSEEIAMLVTSLSIVEVSCMMLLNILRDQALMLPNFLHFLLFSFSKHRHVQHISIKQHISICNYTEI